ncbi:MAG TPA: GNAT family N-acetyltransferase [Longimicrobium sp.]|nr:GNAT family N-acetyltransferase [Longimicrobium sp.]
MPSPASGATSASAESSAGASLRVRELPPGARLGPFIELTWQMNARDPQWVPPLRMVFEQLLDRRKHPFHEHATVAYFLAERDGTPVGRIAAVVNHRSNEFHEDRIGFFGLFESVDDPAVASALLEAAAAWLKGQGMETMRGPFNLSTNDELYSPGVLFEGFDTPPVFMMGHNPPYYARLMDAAGLAKAKDLVAYWLPHNQPPERLLKGVERAGKREGWRIRPVRMKELKKEIGVIQEVYNSAWERNWGFVPMTHAEFENMAKEFRPVVDPDLILIAEKDDGEPIGFMLAIPDFNQAIKHLPDGRLFPFGFLKFLWHKRKIRTARLMTLGLKPGYQSSGIGAAMYLRCFQQGAEKGYLNAEGSWILEDNGKMCQAMEKIGAHIYKRYRVYERPL